MKLTILTFSIIALLATALVAADIPSAQNTTATPPAANLVLLGDYDPTSNSQCFARADGMDIPGSDVGWMKTADPNACLAYCREDVNCKAWTWSAGTCWLKGGIGHPVFYAGAYSGVKRLCSDTSMFLVVDNCDIRGNDGESRPATNYAICIAYSMGSFTWSDYNGGTCWFKTAVKPCEYALNKYTGVLIK